MSFWLVLAIFLYCVTLAGALWYAVEIRRATLFDPITVFLGTLSLFVLPLPIRTCFTDRVEGGLTDQLHQIIPYIPFSLLLISVSLPVFVWAYYSGVAKKLGNIAPAPPSADKRRIRVTVFLICGVSLLMLRLLMPDWGSLLSFLLRGYGSSAELVGKGYLAVGFPWFFVGSLFLLYRYAIAKTKIDLVIFGALFITQLAVYFILGDRHSILFMCLMVVIFINCAIKPLSFKLATSIGLVGFLALNLHGLLRHGNYADLSSFLNQTETSFASNVDKQSIFYTLTVGEFTAPFETMPQMVRKVGGPISPKWGLTYLQAPLFYVPSAIYPSRPAPLDVWYYKEFYGGGLASNEGRQFFFLSEGYLNFGPAGVLLTMIVWGWLLGALHQYRVRFHDLGSALLLYSLALGYMFKCVYGASADVIFGLPAQYLGIAVIGFWLCRCRSAVSSRRDSSGTLDLSQGQRSQL